jgi:protease I
MSQIAMTVGQDFEDAEFAIPWQRLREAGHTVTVVGTTKGEVVRGKRGKESAKVDTTANDLSPDQFDALVIPGGYSPDHLRTDAAIVKFVRGFGSTGKPLAAVCHGPQLLIEADLVRGKRLTSWPSIRKDLENAGARWVDEEVVRDGALITSRKPDDLAAFSSAILSALQR